MQQTDLNKNTVQGTDTGTGAFAGAKNAARCATGQEEPSGNPAAKLKFLIINGPNLNLLGIREPAIYGKDTYETLCRTCLDACRDAGVECELFQSNHEGAIVDKIQEAYGGQTALSSTPPPIPTRVSPFSTRSKRSASPSPRYTFRT